MFGITYKKVGGLRFLKLGRVTVTLSVTTPENYAAKQRKIARHSDEKFIHAIAVSAAQGALHSEITASHQKDMRKIWSQYETCAD